MSDAIDQLIINSPYDEPGQHWRCDGESRSFSLAKGRRAAGYVWAWAVSHTPSDVADLLEVPTAAA